MFSALVPTLVHVVAGRADLVRLASVVVAVGELGVFRQVLVAAGPPGVVELDHDVQAELGVPLLVREADVEGDTDGEQLARAIVEFELVMCAERPAVVVLGGSGNVALGCALAASRQQIALARLEAGMRSWDWTTGETDRVVIDRLCDALFTHGPAEAQNLHGEGISDGRIHVVGNTTVDRLRRHEKRARLAAAWRHHGLTERAYLLVTVRRAENVDDGPRLAAIVDALCAAASGIPVLFCMHEHTAARLRDSGGASALVEAGVHCVLRCSYPEFLSLQLGAGAIVTDSATVPDEATALGVDCYSLAPTAVHPLAFTHGTGILLGDDPSEIASITLVQERAEVAEIPLWDGCSGTRVAEILAANFAFAPELARLG